MWHDEDVDLEEMPDGGSRWQVAWSERSWGLSTGAIGQRLDIVMRMDIAREHSRAQLVPRVRWGRVIDAHVLALVRKEKSAALLRSRTGGGVREG